MTSSHHPEVLLTEVLTLALIVVRVVMQYFIKSLGMNKLYKCDMASVENKVKLILAWVRVAMQ